MPHFFLKLHAPRPTFAMDMTDAERSLMGRHAAYVRGFYERGEVLAYGPVLDPEGSFGIALLEMESLEAAQAFIAADPTVLAGLSRITIAPMMIAGAQASRALESLA